MDLRNKSIHEEHWNVENGNFKGLWSVNAEAAKGADIWQRIDEIVAAYTKLHPMEMELTVRENQAIRNSRLNEWAATPGKGLRWGASIPAGLMFKIQTIYPEVFSNKTLFHRFLKKYKGLTTCQTL